MVSPSFAQEYSIRGASSSIFSRIWDEMDIIYRFIWRNGSESNPFSTEKECLSCVNLGFIEAEQVCTIHLDCGIMETPGQLTSQEIYVLDIPKPDAETVIQVSVNAEQVKTNRIREILLTQTDTVTNIYLYYDNTDYGPRVPLDYTCSTHPDAFVFNIYDDRKQLNCLVLSIPSAEIDLTAHTLPVQDLENNQLITIDLQTGIAT